MAIATLAPAAAPPKTPQEALLHAALFIEEHGWVQHQYRGRNGERCMSSAVIEVTGGMNNEVLYHATCRLVDKYLFRTTDTGSMVGYNDAFGRTAAEVISALRSAAEA